MISPEFVAIIGTTVSGLVAGVTAWNKMVDNQQNLKDKIEDLKVNVDKKIDSHIRDDEDIEKSLNGQFNRVREWIERHEKEANVARLDFQKQISDTTARVDVHASILQQIKESLDRIENYMKGNK